MPEIQAFRGLRYDLARVGSLSDVIAPPYDVVDSELQNHLYNLSPYNFLRLELNRAEPGDADADAIYGRAANIFRTWKSERVFQTEPDPAIYYYTQTFDVEGQQFSRRGFMARVRLQRFGEGNIYPHEQTHAKAKDDRLKLTRATEANLSQIFGLYPDPNNEICDMIEAAVVGQQGLVAIDHLGVKHTMWPITDINIINKVSAAVHTLPMFVADGHHRYETACNYRDEKIAANGELDSQDPANFVLTMMVGMSDPGLVVLPTHRLLTQVSRYTASEIIEKVSKYFEVESYGNGPEVADKCWSQMAMLNDQSVMALYSKQSNEWLLLTAKPEALERMAEIASDQSDDWQNLGVAILHRLVIDDLLGLKGHPKPTYVHQVSEVVDGLNGKLEGNLDYPIAALVMPATIDHIRAISLHGERMPAKSTYFYPKLVSGLVVNPLT
jgi:uncharacterized protein (DUF1015 family)